MSRNKLPNNSNNVLLNINWLPNFIFLAATILALVIANSFFGQSYIKFSTYEISFLQKLRLPHTPLHLINDGLMAIFFFQMGMEIKEELIKGVLSSIKKALLPIGAALGGMVFPALIFLLINGSGEYTRGWGIPIATDIAFSLAIISSLGKKIHASIRVLLIALAIIDDLGAMAVIAIFYTDSINLYYLGAASLIFIMLLFMNWLKVKWGIWNMLAGIALWYCIYNAGVHATIAGALFAVAVPLNQLKKVGASINKIVLFLILPLFTLFNSAILIPNNIFSIFNSRLSLGIILGLVIGKPLGILLTCFTLTKIRLVALPSEVNWSQMAIMSLVAAIGFTMSIFITTLAFDNVVIQNLAKGAIIASLIISILVIFIFSNIYLKKK